MEPAKRYDATRTTTQPVDDRSLVVVNFGCGPLPETGCLNVDGSPTILFAKLPFPASMFGSRRGYILAVRRCKVRYGLAQNLTFPNHSIDGFFTSHTLEHLRPRQCEDLLKRVLKWLKPGAVLRVILPDLKRMALAYARNEIGADEFVKRTHLVQGDLPWWQAVFGHTRHQWMYDSKSFTNLLVRLGYRDVCEVSHGESRLVPLAELDLQVRRQESFYIEAIR